MSAPDTESSPDVAAAFWTTALEEHRRWLRAVVWARLGEADAVEEVMQEVAVAATAQNGRMQQGNAAAWLYRVAVRQTLLFRRRAGRRRNHAERYAARLATTTPDEGGCPLSWLMAAEQNALVRVALGRLAPRDREVLLLKYAEDCTCRQIANRLGVRETTVQTRLHRARKRLRTELAMLNITEEDE